MIYLACQSLCRGMVRHLPLEHHYDGSDGLRYATGLVRIFEWDETSKEWEQIGQDLVGTRLYGQFGNSVSHSYQGNRLRVVSGEFFASIVRINDYNSTAGIWESAGKGLVSEGRNEWFGHSVSLSENGDVLAIGCRQAHEGRGATHIFQWNDETNNWLPMEEMNILDQTIGYSTTAVVLSGDGNVVAVGKFTNNGGFGSTLLVQVFERGS